MLNTIPASPLLDLVPEGSRRAVRNCPIKVSVQEKVKNEKKQSCEEVAMALYMFMMSNFDNF